MIKCKKKSRKSNKTKLLDENNNVITNDERGAYLMRSLGLDKIKKERPIKEQKVIKNHNIYEDFAAKKFNYLPDDFNMVYNDKFGYIVTHKCWNGTYITNEDRYLMTKTDAKDFIKQYCEDTNKPYGERNLKFHLINN